MKTRKQKVIRIGSIIVSIFLLASFFVLPVAALDEFTEFTISNIFYTFGTDVSGSSSTMRPFSNLRAVGVNTTNPTLTYLNSKVTSNLPYEPYEIDTGSKYMDYYYDDLFGDYEYRNYYFVYYVNQLFDDSVTRTISAGDTFYISTSELLFYPTAPFTKFRLTIRDWGHPLYFDYGEVVGYSENFNVTFSEDEDIGTTDPIKDIKITFPNAVTSQYLCLCLEFVAPFDESMTSDFSISIGKLEFDVLFGSGVSPNYPIYPSAPGGNDVGNYGSAEQQLIQSQGQGLSQGANSMQSAGSNLQSLSSDLKLMSFVPVLSGALDKIATIPGIMPLVNISLSLGLFASLMGLAASIVSAADRRAGQAKREAQRESRKK